ncbi:FecCD family ABC transporter permease [Solimicrobium silvestre]|uniref:ABC-type Fe3+-siderophore transport system permease component n=1 Tax=Solimicrobium silvestre TaxID=2099400 RepID=A0A2S9H0Y7_9BURK|nr:iron ABC transporter permease [Solimicrobium silvestre]PRC93628.1 ABC-type Fe3+-siderophore transport system permease component [Solimicrobium silvestre]
MILAPAQQSLQLRSVNLTIPVLLLILCAIIIISIGSGAVPIAPRQVLAILGSKIGWGGEWIKLADFSDQQAAVLSLIRLPRVLLGILVGAGLACSGVALQGLFRNPLADPGLIGVSGGAALGATSVIVMGATWLPGLSQSLGLFTLPLAAFLGGFGIAFLIYQLARNGGITALPIMLLAGIAVNSLTGAAIGSFTYIADDAQLRSLTFWSMGSLGNASWDIIALLTPIVTIAIYGMARLIPALNALALGEAEAGHMGFNTNQIKRWAIFWSALAVGSLVAFTGMIGFIGLVTPHVIRLLCGPNHRIVMPASALLGAIFILLADLCARTAVAPAEIPIGILTALIGAPFFLGLLLKQRANWRG